MGRRETRRQGRRDTIIIVATRHFLEHGYSGTSMSAIAATLGGSKGTLWNYFPSKEELFTAVIDHASSVFCEQLSKILDPRGDLASILYNCGLSLLEKVTSPSAIALYRLVVAEAGRFPEVGQIFYERVLKRTIMLVADFLDVAMKRGQLREAPPIETAHTFTQLCVSHFQQQLLLGMTTNLSESDLQQETTRAVSLFLLTFAPDESHSTE